MRFASRTLQSIAAPTMSSSRFNSRGRNQWRRGFAERPPADGSLVSGDSHLRTVRNANYGFRRGDPRQPYRPRPPAFRPPPPLYGPPPPSFGFPPPQSFGPPPPQSFGPPPPAVGAPRQVFGPAHRSPPQPRPADYYRNWSFALPQPPPQCERFTVLSYNILADYLASDHRPKLYFHIPHYMLDWEWRKKRLLLEFGLWSPDILCLQEVDRFHDLEEELAIRGYAGIWKIRTGNAIDGCAIFWRKNRFQLRHEEHIEFKKLGLRDNVAQICVFESRIESPVDNEFATPPTSSVDEPRQANQVVICNIHVLYNPKRGEIKLAQVRTLFDRAYAVSRIWNDAPVIVCGDFNCTPKSPLYNFISEQKLSLSGLARDQVSGQYSATIGASRPYVGSGFSRAQPFGDQLNNMTMSVDRGNCSPQKDMENIKSTEKVPPRQTGEAEPLHVFCIECSSAEHKPLDPFKDTANSFMNRSDSPSSKGNDGNQEVVATASCDSDYSSGGVQHEFQVENNVLDVQSGSNMLEKQISQSNSNDSDELNDNFYLESSSGDSNPSQRFSDSSAAGENKVIEGSIDSTPAVDLTGHETVKEYGDASCTSLFESNTESSSSDIAARKPPDTEAVVDDNALTEIFSVDMVSRTFSVDDKLSTSEGKVSGSTDLATGKEKVDPVISSQTSSETDQSGLSTCADPSVDLTLLDVYPEEMSKINIVKEMSKINIVNPSSSGDYDNNSSVQISTSIPNDASSNTTYNRDKSEHSDLDDVSHPSADSSSTDELLRNRIKNQSGIGEANNVLNDICSSEENSDPNFFKELLGMEQTDFGGDVISAASGRNPSSSSSVTHDFELEPSGVEIQAVPSADVEKHSYNPYLWTPMEIEVASGNAECAYIEHNLKLRSVYADVEDYAGTKDSSREPQVTSYNRQFMGTVDYIWCSEGLQTVKVLDTIPKQVLQQTPGFPTKKWGSDHISLVCQLAFTKGFSDK